MPVRVLAVALLPLACVRQVELPSPFAPGQAGLIVLMPPEAASSVPQVYGVEQGSSFPVLTVDDESTVVALGLGGSLEERGLSDGEIPLGTGRGRPLPAAQSIHRLVAPARGWTRIEVLPAEVAALRLAPLTRCDLPDACVVIVEGVEVCERPCPEATPPATPFGPSSPVVPDPECPSGWASTSVNGMGCSPSPRRDCLNNERQPLDASDCAPVAACPTAAEPFPALPPMGPPVVHVLASASGPSDGSPERPFSTVGEALEVLPGPVRVALGPGRYGLPELRDGLQLIGSCPAQVELGPVRVPAGARVEIEGVHVAADLEVLGHLALSRVSVDAPDEAARVGAGGRLEARSSLLQAGDVGLNVSGDAAVALDDVEIRSTQQAAVRWAGPVTLELSRVSIRAPSGSALLGQDGVVTLTDTWLEGGAEALFSLAGSARMMGQRVFALSPLLLTASGPVRVDLSSVGVGGSERVAILEDGAQLLLARSRLRGTAPQGVAFSLEGRSSSLALRALDARGVGDTFVLGHTGTEALLEDARILGWRTVVEFFGMSEVGLRRVETTGRARFGASLVGSEFSTYRGGRDWCLGGIAGPSRVRMSAEDLRVLGSGGLGLALCPGTTAALDRVAISDAEVGVFAECRATCNQGGDAPFARIDDLQIDRGEVGVLHRGGTLALSRARIEGQALYGLYAWASEVTVFDLEVSRIGREGIEDLVYCSMNQAEQLRGPASAVFVEGLDLGKVGVARLERFRLSRAACASVTVGASGSFDLVDGALEESRFGVSFIRDSRRSVIAPSVTFRGNLQNISVFAP